MIGKPGAGRVPGARALQRAGRPHDGDLGEDARGVPRRTGRPRSASPVPASTATTPSTRSGRCATAAPRCSSGMGGNFASATPDTDVTEAALRSCCVDGAGVDEAEPQPPRARRDRADPADAGPHRQGHPGRRQTAWSRSRIRCRWCICRAAASTRRAIRCAARWRSCANSPGPCSAPIIRCRGRSSTTTTTRSATPSPTWCPAATTTTPRSASPTASSCRTRPAIRANSPPAQGKPTSR